MEIPKCPDCGSPMQLRETTKIKYKKSGQPRKFWGCTRYPLCKATHGAHPDGRPLGIPGNAETKQARILAHEAFDALWKTKMPMFSRGQAYRWLQCELGLGKQDCHIGSFDVATCQRVIQLCQERIKQPPPPGKPSHMKFTDAMDMADMLDDDLPDGAFFALAHEIAGLEYGEGFTELAGDGEDLDED
jgi:hypothetical protein